MRPIGVFDSGVGGLTVVAALRRALPLESILYLGDTARLPYGTKSPETVARYTRRNIAFLAERGVKAIVVACNTASSIGLDEIETDLPLWGVIEPGARAAAEVSKQRVGVLATESTIESGSYPEAIRRFRPELEILVQPCPLFVPLVEEGWQDDPIAEVIARRYLEPLLDRSVDTLVLGCTHYPLLERTLRRVADDDIELINSADVTSEHVARALGELGLTENDASPESATGSVRLCMTDAGARFTRIAERILGPLDSPTELVDV